MWKKLCQRGERSAMKAKRIIRLIIRASIQDAIALYLIFTGEHDFANDIRWQVSQGEGKKTGKITQPRNEKQLRGTQSSYAQLNGIAQQAKQWKLI